MSQFELMLENVILGSRADAELYDRIFVVSAYGGVTDMLLEHKKSGEPGIYRLFADNDPEWQNALERVRAHLQTINAGLEDLGLSVETADSFVDERVDGLHDCLVDLRRLSSYGHFELDQQLPAVREMLSALGEAHSAHNSALILQSRQVNARFVDLTGWMEEENLPFDDKIAASFADVDMASELPIATGYTKCREGIMTTFDRGYSEITFSKIAVVTDACEGVIHKEYHLSSGDPAIIGEDRVKPICFTNYDVADQLADLRMEAIHPKAAKGMEYKDIPIRVKNAFDPEHPGTLISKDYRSEDPRVEIITGRNDMVAVEVWDPDMVGESGYDYRLLSCLKDFGISYVAKNTNANTITHYIPTGAPGLEQCIEAIRAGFPSAGVGVSRVALVCAIGSNMKVPGFLSKAADALAQAEINILAMDQCMRQVNMQFVVGPDDFDAAVKALHAGLVEG